MRRAQRSAFSGVVFHTAQSIDKVLFELVVPSSGGQAIADSVFSHVVEEIVLVCYVCVVYTLNGKVLWTCCVMLFCNTLGD